MAKSFLNQSGLPLGLRNNNPGNLRFNASIKWKGQTGQNKGFSVFSNILFGIRAYGMDLRSDIKKGKNTLEKLIYEYAPPSENNTEAYIDRVSKSTGIGRKQILTPDSTTLKHLARGFFNVELGPQHSKLISDSDISDGIDLIDNTGAVILGSGLGLLVIIGLTFLITYK